MGIDLGRAGFALDDWYWRVTEDDRTFGGAAAAREFLTPFAKLARDHVAIGEIAASTDGREVTCTFGDRRVAIKIDPAIDRVAVARFVGDVNRELAVSKVGHAFALVVPRRYALRGVLLADDELAQLAGDPKLLVPFARGSRPSLA